MRDALEMLDHREPDFAYEGEMNIDAALDQAIRDRLFPGSRYEGAANVLVFASIPTRPRASATSSR
jgi:malate dehydrogenase (oxaloacetate-decarboxylating)(NADP+)